MFVCLVWLLNLILFIDRSATSEDKKENLYYWLQFHINLRDSKAYQQAGVLHN